MSSLIQRDMSICMFSLFGFVFTYEYLHGRLSVSKLSKVVKETLFSTSSPFYVINYRF